MTVQKTDEKIWPFAPQTDTERNCNEKSLTSKTKQQDCPTQECLLRQKRSEIQTFKEKIILNVASSYCITISTNGVTGKYGGNGLRGEKISLPQCVHIAHSTSRVINENVTVLVLNGVNYSEYKFAVRLLSLQKSIVEMSRPGHTIYLTLRR